LSSLLNPRKLLLAAELWMRRIKGAGEAGAGLQSGGVWVDETARTAYVDGKAISLTAKEFDLLLALVQNAGRVVSRESLALRGWPEDDEVDPHAIRCLHEQNKD